MTACVFCIFFFQAEDGIRDYKVTGVQTCALRSVEGALGNRRVVIRQVALDQGRDQARLERRKPLLAHFRRSLGIGLERLLRLEERRVGKECRSRWWPDHLKKKRGACRR